MYAIFDGGICPCFKNSTYSPRGSSCTSTFLGRFRILFSVARLSRQSWSTLCSGDVSMKTRGYVLATVFFGFVIGCADPGPELTEAELALTAATDACYQGCTERDLEPERCAEACANIGGIQCYQGCLTRGGDELDCRAVCARGGAACYEGCLVRGGDELTCRDACTSEKLGGSVGQAEKCQDGDEAERKGAVYVCQGGEWVPKG
jgi:hypothetical protein